MADHTRDRRDVWNGGVKSLRSGSGFWAKIHKWLALADGDPDPVLVRRAGCSSPGIPIERVQLRAYARAEAASGRRWRWIRAAGGPSGGSRREGVTGGETDRGPACWLGRQVALVSQREAKRRPVLYDLADARRLPRVRSRRLRRPGSPRRIMRASLHAARVSPRSRREQRPNIAVRCRPGGWISRTARRRAIYVAADTGDRSRRGARPCGGSTISSGACTSWTGAAMRISTHGC